MIVNIGFKFHCVFLNVEWIANFRDGYFQDLYKISISISN